MHWKLSVFFDLHRHLKQFTKLCTERKPGKLSDLFKKCCLTLTQGTQDLSRAMGQCPLHLLGMSHGHASHLRAGQFSHTRPILPHSVCLTLKTQSEGTRICASQVNAAAMADANIWSRKSREPSSRLALRSFRGRWRNYLSESSTFRTQEVDQEGLLLECLG